MSHRLVGVLFLYQNQKYVTMLDSRSKNRFQRLLKKWVAKDSIIYRPEKDEEFKFIHYEEILSQIEQPYVSLQNTPAMVRAADHVIKLIHTIRILNEGYDDETEDDSDDDD